MYTIYDAQLHRILIVTACISWWDSGNGLWSKVANRMYFLWSQHGQTSLFLHFMLFTHYAWYGLQLQTAVSAKARWSRYKVAGGHWSDFHLHVHNYVCSTCKESHKYDTLRWMSVPPLVIRMSSNTLIHRNWLTVFFKQEILQLRQSDLVSAASRGVWYFLVVKVQLTYLQSIIIIVNSHYMYNNSEHKK